MDGRRFNANRLLVNYHLLFTIYHSQKKNADVRCGRLLILRRIGKTCAVTRTVGVRVCVANNGGAVLASFALPPRGSGVRACGRGLGLRFRLLAVALVKAVYAACRVDELLLAREERVTLGADFKVKVVLLRRAVLESAPAGAVDRDFVVVGMNSLLHFWFLSVGGLSGPSNKAPSYRRLSRIVKLCKDLDARRVPQDCLPSGARGAARLTRLTRAQTACYKRARTRLWKLFRSSTLKVIQAAFTVE